MTTLGLEYLKHTEQARANKAKESQAASELQETKRSNIVREELQHRTLEESMRHNVATETEAHRSNIAQEIERHRSNVAQEVEQQRSNLAREVETNRSNLAREEQTAFINAEQVVNWSAQINEAKRRREEETRHNKYMEGISTADTIIKGIDTGSKVMERSINAIMKPLDILKLVL